jgi:hypothetical protein
MLGFGIMVVAMKYHKENLKPIRWKVTILNCAITWLAWAENLGASLVVLMLWSAHYECLSTHSTVGSCTSSVSQTIRLT